MAIRKGVCTNIDGCSKAQNDTIQEIDDSEEFVCPECGHELEEIKETSAKKANNKPMMIVIAAVAVVAVCIGCYFAFSSPKEEAVIPETVVADSTATVEEVAAVAEAIDTVKADTVAEVEEAVSATEVIAEEPVAEKPAEKPAAPKAQPAASNGTHSLGYATWSGAMRGGKPHGNGTMTYKSSHLIDSRDPKGRTAQAGEYVIGEWDNGKLVQGRWFKSDGSKEVIIIGKAG